MLHFRGLFDLDRRGLVVGALCGAFNGLMIAYFKVVPMIATLAMLNMARGLCFVLSGGSSVSGVKSNYSFLGAARLLQTADKPTGWIPIITIFVIVAVFIVHILLSKTVFGRHVYATGSNSNVAHLSGINTAKITFLSHVICGIMAAMGGVLNAPSCKTASPAPATPMKCTPLPPRYWAAPAFPAAAVPLAGP